MPTNEELSLNTNTGGEVLLKLGRTGLYTWSIRVPFNSDGTLDQKDLSRLAQIEAQLQLLFPNHPEPAKSKSVTW